jgi:hypothetical protein
VPRDPDDRPDDGPTEPAWYEQPSVIFVAAAAGLVAVALLVFAVLQTSRHATAPTELPTSTPAQSTTTSHTLKPYTPTTTYTTMTMTEPATPEPSVPEEPPPPPSVETTDIPTVNTTVSIPYATTTAPIAGAF